MARISDKTINLCNGEKLSYNHLFDIMYGGLCVFAKRFLDQDIEAEDVVQESFIKLWESFEEFDSLVAIKAYLFRAVRNKCLNVIRHAKVKDNYEADYASKVDTESYFYQQMVEVETQRIIHETLNSLPVKCSRVMRLSMEGLTNNEIAEDLGVSLNTVKTQKKRGYEIMRQKLKTVLDLLLFMGT